MNSFINTIKDILQNEEIKAHVNFLFNEGHGTPGFSNYFGINYTEKEIKTIKLYFSYFHLPNKAFFDKIGLNQEYYNYILQNWIITNNFFALHEGLTIALKININKTGFSYNFYAYIRSKAFDFKISQFPFPKNTQEKQGISIEWDHKNVWTRNYFYITEKKEITQVLTYFNLKNVPNDIHLIEYTESRHENKINILYLDTQETYKYLCQNPNTELMSLCAYLKEKHNIYFFGPGVRKDSDVKALYFVTKDSIYMRQVVNSLERLFHHLK